MPVPGPRTQYRPDPGYTNPEHEEPSRINHWHRPGPIARAGESPGMSEHDRRGNVLGAGQVRRMWRQAINFVDAMPAYSWTRSAPDGVNGRHYIPPGPLAITTALRYMTRSFYAGAGSDNTEFHGLHTRIRPRVRSKPVSLGAGQIQNRPTIRNRLSSFGSRVPPINSESPAAQK